MTKISLVIQSHLSDAVMGIRGMEPGQVSERHITYVKKIIAKYPDTSTSVSDEELQSLW